MPKLYAALAQFGAPLEGLATTDFAERGPFFHMGHEPVAVDILTELPGSSLMRRGIVGSNTLSTRRVA